MIRQAQTILTEIKHRCLFIQSRLFGRSVLKDPQYSPFGDDSHPIKGMKALRAEMGNKGNTAIIGYLNTNALAEVGEKRLYSTDADGNEKAYVWFKNDGQLQLLGTGDFLARFNELKAGFDELKADHNDLVNKWNTFAGAYTPGSPSTLGTPPTASAASASSASIDNAKIEEIETTSA